MQRIFLAIFGAILVALFVGLMRALARRRAESGGPPKFHQRAATDYLWAVIPWLMIIACIIPAARQILAER